MTLFHFFNCAALAFGPHVVYYKATPLSEYGTGGAVAKAAVVYLVAMLVKLILWASLLKVSDEDGGGSSSSRTASGNVFALETRDSTTEFDLYQELLKAAIGLVDVAGLWYALTQVTHRNISFSHKFQAVGLGWALAQSLAQRAAPLWFGAGGMEFKWDFLADAAHSNADLVLTLSLAALGSLLWLRKNKPRAATPFLIAAAAAIVLLPVLASYLQHVQHWQLQQMAAFHMAAAVVAALVTWQLYNICSTTTARS